MSNDKMEFKEFKKKFTLRIHNELEKILVIDKSSNKILEPMRYSSLNGSKYIRSLLVYATGSALNLEEKFLDQPATAIELIHTYSLIHDDLPCMDDDDVRRGVASCHVKFNESSAVLAGDALQSLAFEVLSKKKFTEIDDNFYSSLYECASHAQIISKSKREELIDKFIMNDFKGHIDTNYFIKSVVYKHPLIVQLFPETENRSNWGDKNRSSWDILLSNISIKLLKSDTDIDSWEKIYFISKLKGKLNIIIYICVIILIIVYLIYRKKSILK